MTNTNKYDAKINAQKKKVDQALAELKKFKDMKKAEERREQTERAGKRGVLLEKLLPDVSKLDDTRFKIFLEKTVANDFGRRTLATILSEQTKITVVANTPAPAPSNTAPPVKSATPAQRTGTGINDNKPGIKNE